MKYPEGTLPHALISSLLADQNHSADANLAMDIIESLKRS
jgi:hypothetical protein